MNRFLFWMDWRIGYKLLYTIGLLILFAFLILLGYHFWLGDASIITWSTEGELENVPMILDRFTSNFFDFTVEADSYLLVEEFKASGIQFNELSYYFQLAGILIGSIFILTAISDLPMAWYAAGITVIVFLIAVMNLEQQFTPLRLTPGQTSNQMLPMVLMAAVAGISFFFRTIGKGASYLLRFVVYSAITAAAVWYIREHTVLQHPVMQISSYSIIVPLLLLAGVALLHGKEVIRAILFIVTNGSGSVKGRNFRFIFLWLFYLANLVYAFAHLNKGYDLDIYYLHPAPLFIITVLLGIWGFRKREEQHYATLFPFAPTGAFLYLGMAILAVSTYTFGYGSGNESYLQMCEDVVLNAHIGMAIGGFGYVFFNFSPIIAAGKKAHRILYKPPKLEFSWSWMFGVLLFFGLIFGNGVFIYYQGSAAFSISQADLFWAEGQPGVAEQIYPFALQQEPYSHRVNYSLATIEQERNHDVEAYTYLKNAQVLYPRPHDYAKMAAIRNSDNEYLKALFDLQRGTRRFPESGELYNNLALQFNQKMRTSLVDSVYIYFDLARQHASRPEVVESNMFTLWTKYAIHNSLDSIYAEWEPRPYIGTKANELAFLNKIGKRANKPLDQDFLPDSILSAPQLCYLYNYALNQPEGERDSLISVLQYYAEYPENTGYQQYLYFATGNLLYTKGLYESAFEYLKTAAFKANDLDAYFPNYLGLRMLQHGEYEQAEAYFVEASRKGNPHALFNAAVAQSEFEDKSLAIKNWKALTFSGKANEQTIAHEMLAYLVPDSLPSLQLNAIQTDDNVRYRYLHYHQKTLSDQEFDVVYGILRDATVKVLIATERIESKLDQADIDGATKYLQLVTTNGITDESNAAFQMAYLRYAYLLGNIDADFNEKVGKAEFPAQKEGLRDFYRAAYFAKQGDIEQAEKSYQSSLKKLPFSQDARLAFNAFYKKNDETEKAYQMLVTELGKHPEATEVLKAYAITCLDLGYISYAEYSVDKLSTLVEKAEYDAFLTQYVAKLEEVRKTLEEWNE